IGSPAQAEETVREAAHQMHEDAHHAAVEVKHAAPHPRVRCRDGRSTFKRRGACRGHGGIRPSR
ncbi:MAG: hypothetical protein ACXU7H_03055, partial [Burkholderiaceae bacterium]